MKWNIQEGLLIVLIEQLWASYLTQIGFSFSILY